MILSRKLRCEEVIRTSKAIHIIIDNIKNLEPKSVLNSNYSEYLIKELQCSNIFDFRYEGCHNGEYIYHVKYLKDLK